MSKLTVLFSLLTAGVLTITGGFASHAYAQGPLLVPSTEGGVVPTLFRESRWGTTKDACEAEGDFAPGLVVWRPDGVVIEGTEMRVVKVTAKGKNFMAARMHSGFNPMNVGLHSFAVLGEKKLVWTDERERPHVAKSYMRCGLAENEDRPSPSEMMQASRWGVSVAACRDETGDGRGVIVFLPHGAVIEGEEAEMGRPKVQGQSFLRGPFYFRDASGAVTTRELDFTVVGRRRLGYGEYVDGRLVERGRYLRCD